MVASISHFVNVLQNLHVVLPTKNVSFAFYLLLLISVTLFLVELRWPAAYFLLLIFQISLHDN